LASAQLQELMSSNDPTALEQWKQTRRKEIEVRYQQAGVLGAFLDKIDRNRDGELSDLKRERRSE
jgi:hypothetical protein